MFKILYEKKNCVYVYIYIYIYIYFLAFYIFLAFYKYILTLVLDIQSFYI